MTVDQAKADRVCRICARPIRVQGPMDWPDLFGEMRFPEHVILNFGKEFAHKECLDNELRRNDAE